MMNGEKDSEELIQKLLLPALQKLKIKDYKLESKNGTVKGDGYLGLILAIKVIFNKAATAKQQLNFILKATPRDETCRDYAPIRKYFEREIYAYTELIPAFEKFQMKKSIPKPFNCTVKYYNACLDEGFEGLLLEDLKAENYKHWNRRLAMDENHAKVVLKELGRLHALSFAIRDQAPEDFKTLTSNLDDIFKEGMLMMKMDEGVSLQIKIAANMLANKGFIRESEIFNILARKTSEIFSTYSVMDDQLSVILQGDSWCNNFLFKYEVCDFSISNFL